MAVDPVSGEQFLGYVVAFFKAYLMIVVPLALLLFGVVITAFVVIYKRIKRNSKFINGAMAMIGRLK